MLAQRLYALRKEKKLTMKHMGGIIGVSETAWSKYEKRNSEPSSASLVKIADYFGVTVDYLLGRTNIKDDKIYDTLHDQVSLVKKFEDMYLGDPSKMISLIYSFEELAKKYESGQISEGSFYKVLYILNDIILDILAISSLQNDKQIIEYYEQSSVNLLSQYNRLFGSNLGIMKKE